MTNTLNWGVRSLALHPSRYPRHPTPGGVLSRARMYRTTCVSKCVSLGIGVRTMHPGPSFTQSLGSMGIRPPYAFHTRFIRVSYVFPTCCHHAALLWPPAPSLCRNGGQEAQGSQLAQFVQTHTSTHAHPCFILVFHTCVSYPCFIPVFHTCVSYPCSLPVVKGPSPW